jgi:hypothetical protein
MKMFGRIKHADPDRVYFSMIDGKPCFSIYLVFAQKTTKGTEEEFTYRQLDLIAREKFNIEMFERKQPNKKGMWQVIESDDGRSWKLRFFPFEDTSRPESDRGCSLKFVLELLGRN